jgi:guanylate kinase
MKSNKRKIFVINGFPQSGKDTFINMCSKYATVYSFSSVDRVKMALSILGWNGVKTPEQRKALSDLKDMSTNLFDGPVKYIKDMVSTVPVDEDCLIFIHAREIPELQRYEKELGAETILIRRDIHAPITNHADANVEDYYYTYIINNNSTLAQLEERVKSFIQTVKEDWLCLKQ